MSHAISILLAETTAEGWRPGIGDPTIMGWLTVAAYFAAAFLCSRAAQRERHHAAAGEHARTAQRFWWMLAAGFALLGVNKQLDLQSAFTALGKWMAQQQGWYDQRRIVQFAFIAMLALGALALILWILTSLRGRFQQFRLAIVGTVFIIAFVVIRAASFHHIDEFLDITLLGVEMNWALELGGIAMVAIAAWRHRPSDAAAHAPAATTPRPAAQSIHDERASFRWMVQRMGRNDR